MIAERFAVETPAPATRMLSNINNQDGRSLA
jgi:hypothetical protein